MAYERVSRFGPRSDQRDRPASAAPAKYKTSCNKMPGLIHQSGALQALVFQISRDNAGVAYVDHLAETFFLEEGKTHRDLIVHVQGQQLGAYMALTRDLSEIAQWFRRFAQTELGSLGEED